MKSSNSNNAGKVDGDITPKLSRLPDMKPPSYPPSVHWDKPASSSSSSFLANLDATRESSESLTRQAIASAQDVFTPDLYDLILTLNRDCGFEAFFSGLIEIFDTNFGAQRLSLAVPRDATDIINIPWGLKALWNKNEKISDSPVNFGMNSKAASKARKQDATTTTTTEYEDEGDDDSWDTDFEDDYDCEAEVEVDADATAEPEADAKAKAKPEGEPVDEEQQQQQQQQQQQNDLLSSPRPSLSHTSSFKRKFSLTRKLSFKRSTSSTSVSSPNSQKQAVTPPPKSDNTTPTPSNQPKKNPVVAPQQPPALQGTSQSLEDSGIFKNPHARIFDTVRTLEWEEDPLIDAEGVLNVLDNDQLVMLQRKYTKQPSSVTSGASGTNGRPSKEFFYDTEQATVSPWSRSPAPSPAIRESNENPFFKPSSDEMDRAFEDPNPGHFSNVTRPVDAIGYEDTFSIIHILLIVPSKPNSGNHQRSAPLAILSFMSTLIPFPSKLRSIIDRLAPHIATSYVQACAHSNLVKLVASRTPSRPNSGRGIPVGSHLRRSRSPFYDLSPASSSNSASAAIGRVADTNNSRVFDSLEHSSKFYSSLKEDFYEDSPATKQLEILASDAHRKNTSSTTGTTTSGGRKSSIRRHRVRPHIRKFLHSYGASFMSEPEKSSSRHDDDIDDDHDMSPPNRKRYSGVGGLSSGGSGSGSGTASSTFEMAIPSNKLLRTMLDAIPVHVYMAEPVQGDITWVSNRTLSFRGQTAEQFVRDPTASVHPDDLDDYMDSWNSALEKGEPLGRMVQVRRFDGRYRSFFMRAVPLRDEKGVVTHWFCTMMDIHNQRQSQIQALQQAHETAGEQKYKSLAESTPIIVFTTHPIKGVQYANNKWFDYSGRSPAQTYGFQYVYAIHPEDRAKGVLPLSKEGLPDVERFNCKENKSGIYSVELRLLNKDGEYRWHLVTFSCSDLTAQSDSIWFGTCTDIHDQKLIQQKLKEAKDAAQRTIEGKSRFLSNMSHEIRTPLIGISGMVGFLLDTPLTDEQLDYCHTISSSSEALLMVINDILDLSKVESGKMHLMYSWFHVRRLVEEVNELLSSMAISKNLELNYIIDNDVPSWVKGDRVRLRQVMLNLIGNAIKFTDAGEIFTQCRISEIRSDSSVMMEFQVHDTGRGFTEEDAKRMFQPYSQLHDGFKQGSSANNSGSASGTGGTGLGLVISRQLIKLHGGELTAKGIENKGSTFTFTCKVILPSEDDGPTAEERSKAMGALDPDDQKPTKISTDLNILVVCPYKYTFQSISHHILNTVADPSRCEIESVNDVDKVMSLFEKEPSPTYSHVVVNTNEIKDVVRLVNFMYGIKKQVAKMHLILLTTPTQRSKINKRVKVDDEGSEPKITFLPKPLKPSRYSVVFDPSRIRVESRDTKMMNAQQALESHKSVFDQLSKFAYGKGYRILLAEDNLVNQKVMSKFLAKAGLKCDVAADGEVCTSKFFEKGVGYYSMILCDLDMPRKDGFGVCEEIRAWEKEMNLTPKIPIVALSAYVMSDMSERCDQVGFTQYISKPVEFSHLKDVIIEILTDVETQ